jgi:hypothetical protein
VKPILFAGRYPFHDDGPELAATLLEQFSEQPNPDGAFEVVRLMIEAARLGDSKFFRNLGDWVDNAHHKPKGYGICGDAVDATIRDFISICAVGKNPAPPTGPEVFEFLKEQGFKVSLRYAFDRLRKVEHELKVARAKWLAESS